MAYRDVETTNLAAVEKFSFTCGAGRIPRPKRKLGVEELASKIEDEMETQSLAQRRND